MKSFIVLAVCFAAALAAPTDKDAVIVAQEQDNIGVGPFNYSFETSNGIQARANADVEVVALEDGTPIEALVVRGISSYLGNDGNVYSVEYIADKDGYRAVGDHIPKA